MKILLTGGLGFIGSHVALALCEAGHQVYLLDNLSNSNADVLIRLERIVGQKLPFFQVDVRDKKVVKEILQCNQINAVMHFAGLKAVAESKEKPLEYFDNNVAGTISLLEAMSACKIFILVFSSSATVYGQPAYLPYDEDHPTSPTNPYGQTKLIAEQILRNLAESNGDWSISCLRYFNPVGAHESGLIGENPNGTPSNLIPYIARVAVNDLEYLSIFGNDYDTIDGTGERDYIHVQDLAEGHVEALNYLCLHKGFQIFNLGSGQSTSVLEMVNAFVNASGINIPYKMCGRRGGDLPKCFANPDKAAKLLNWKTRRTIQQMCSSAWNFQRQARAN